MTELNAAEIVLQRLARNGLAEPFAGPLDCVRALGGIQSQFQQWAEVSIMNRCSGRPGLADLAELYRRHEIINLWGQRHTLHMYVKDDWDPVSDLYEPVISAKNYAHKRFADDFNFLMEQIAGECAAGRPLPKARVLALAEERMQGRHSEDDYLGYMLIMLCCLRGIFCGLPEKPGIKSFVGRHKIHTEPWQENAERAAAALADFMLRYFQYYGPASLADFSHWSGLSQKAARGCLDSLKDRLQVYGHAGREYYLHGPWHEVAGDAVYLLGKFDPLFVSYRHKDWIIPDKLQKRVWRNAGWVEGVVIDGGKAVGTWRHTLKGKKMSLEVSQFGKIKISARKKLKSRAERLAAFWEKELEAIVFS